VIAGLPTSFIFMKFILGQKVAMTQLWQNDTVVPVTKVSAGPCTIVQLKTKDKDGYMAVQLGFGTRRAKLLSKSVLGHFKNLGAFRYVKEFRLEESSELKPGDQISVATFAPGDRLTIVGISKGKGFQGVVKRHHFHGQDATHGNKDQLRASGSVGAGGVQHVFKGTRMAGRMGGDQVTLHDVEVISVDEHDNSLFVKGAVPGARHSLVMLFGDGELKLGLPEIKEEKIEEPITTEAEQVVEQPVEEVPAEEENVRTTDTTDEQIDTDKTPEETTEEVKE